MKLETSLVMNKEISENRIGRFEITRSLLYRSKKLHLMFSKMTIIRAEFLFHRQTVAYYAYSMLFEKVPRGNKAPRYTMQINSGKDPEVEAVKIINGRKKDGKY